MTAPPSQRIPLQQLAAAVNGGAASVMVLAAHPDDETIAVVGRLGRWPFVNLIHMTQGAPRDPKFARAAGCSSVAEYATLRARELDRALAVAGVPEERSIRLARFDQESCHDLVNLTLEVLQQLRTRKPELLITHPYEGGHPDHDAAAFAAQCACFLGAAAGLRVPMRVEAPYYHRYGGALRVGEFLPEPPWPSLELKLDENQRRTKSAMLNCFASQAAVLSSFPLDSERFRLAPTYDFTAPPHRGLLHYESLGWNVTGRLWRALARSALDALLSRSKGSAESMGSRPCP